MTTRPTLPPLKTPTLGKKSMALVCKLSVTNTNSPPYHTRQYFLLLPLFISVTNVRFVSFNIPLRRIHFECRHHPQKKRIYCLHSVSASTVREKAQDDEKSQDYLEKFTDTITAYRLYIKLPSYIVGVSYNKLSMTPYNDSLAKSSRHTDNT